ncbi:SpoIIIAH-like family protein [Bacillus fonticola]|uniref:SpoIIIAH-like family protein n=1 Tax=Bacillus fonticola TaxID=2728853 RepID=UPI001473B5A1|nr:SpoIIIAH-like family protein [Bacillus fonticola]
MLLKKQTVWLLTMLSLVVVLSVYYITSPEGGPGNMASVEEESGATENVSEDEIANEDVASMFDADELEGMFAEAGDEVFEALRLERSDIRSMKTEELEDMIASSELSALEKSELMDEMQTLQELSAVEGDLEKVIRSLGYSDALVQANGDDVKVVVKANELSRTAADEIIQLVYAEMGSINAVAVEFQPE